MSKLVEQLIPAKIDDLKKAMDEDEKLYVLLHTKAKDFPEDSDYLQLIQELTDDDKEKTLLDVIKTSIDWDMYGIKIDPCFSKAGEKLIGFAAYFTKDDEVIEIKMFSFDLTRPNPVFLRDLKNLLVKLLKEDYKRISWTAKESNKANVIYQKAIEEFKGKKFIKDEKGRDGKIHKVVHYCIENLVDQFLTSEVLNDSTNFS